MDKNEIVKALKKLGLRPKKYLGQNFLINKVILDNILAAAELKAGDRVLEIGPGLGILTEKLAENPDIEVVAIEKDKELAAALEKKFKNCKNLKIIREDILKIANCASLFANRQTKSLSPCLALSRPVSPAGERQASGRRASRPKSLNYKLIANLPYYITSPVIRKFLEEGSPPARNRPPKAGSSVAGRPERMVLMVQKEVAERICAKPPNMSLLSVSVQFNAKTEIIKQVNKESFWPEPKVDSAIIKISDIKTPKDTDPKIFFKIVKAGFSNPRKQLKNNLKGLVGPARQSPGGSRRPRLPMTSTVGQVAGGERARELLKRAKIDETRRAETLTIQEWKNICTAFKNLVK